MHERASLGEYELKFVELRPHNERSDLVPRCRRNRLATTCSTGELNRTIRVNRMLYHGRRRNLDHASTICKLYYHTQINLLLKYQIPRPVLLGTCSPKLLTPACPISDYSLNVKLWGGSKASLQLVGGMDYLVWKQFKLLNAIAAQISLCSESDHVMRGVCPRSCSSCKSHAWMTS